VNAYRFPLGIAALFGLAGVLGQAGGQSNAPESRPSAAETPAQSAPSVLLTLGKKVFVERCAKCHGENGSAPLASGLPLSERKLTDEQIEKNVRGRLKGSPEAEQRAVAAYIRSFQKKS